MRPNAALVEEAAAAAESLEEQAQNLSVLVGTFKMDSHSGSTAVVRREPAAVARAIPAGHASTARRPNAGHPSTGKPAHPAAIKAKGSDGQAGAKPTKPQIQGEDGEWAEF